MSIHHLLGIALVFSALVACGGDGGTGTAGTACSNNSECAMQEACVFTDNACGAGGKTKKCVFVPPSCGEALPSTVCGCDGKAKLDTCLVGDVDQRPGACAPPAGNFWCGGITCSLGQEYCDLGVAAACMPLPVACMGASADCSCFAQPAGPCQCKKAGDGHFELSCPSI